MIIAGIDTETTGLKQEDGHRIIEICISLYRFPSRELLGSYVRRINPQRSILADAQRVHGISISDLQGCQTWDQVAPDILKLLKGSQLAVAHNADFDLPFIAAELMRIGLGVPNIHVFDTMTESRWATWNGKYPRLAELCFALGVEYDTKAAHAADYDVAVMMKAVWAGIDRGVYDFTKYQQKAIMT